MAANQAAAGPAPAGPAADTTVPGQAGGHPAAPHDAATTAAEISAIYRAEFGRVVAALTRRFGDLSLAEDMAQEAFAEAVTRWPSAGVPPNPGAWLTMSARNRAIDRLRRESTRDARHTEAYRLREGEQDMSLDDLTSVADERLRLLFTCCHPALATDVQVALTLRLVGGLTVPEVADAFLIPERTMAQRITRAKRKIKVANIPFRVPPDAELPDRLRGVLGAVYLIFNEGYLPSGGESEVRTELCAEAVRLGRVLCTLMPDEPEVVGLLALMLLIEARQAARMQAGVLVPLGAQDRNLWDRALIAEGHGLVRWCLRRARPGPYQIMAAINAVHTDARAAKDTDWSQIAALYDQLLAATPTPVVALNRAVAIAELQGPAAGLALLTPLSLDGYHPFHATRADLLRRLGDVPAARAEYARAIELAGNPAERAYLAAQLQTLAAASGKVVE